MNIHPLFVHFPIALLVLYTLFEFLTPFVRNKKHLKTLELIKAVFVTLGALSTLTAILTGGIAADIIGETKLVDTHEFFAQSTSFVFWILAAAYLYPMIVNSGIKQWVVNKIKVSTFIFEFWKVCSDIVMLNIIRIPLAALGLVLITITGALGASIVYGPNIDFIVKFIYGIVIK